mgnify:FL=1|jgi:transposase
MKPTYAELEQAVAEQSQIVQQLLDRIKQLEDQLNKHSKNSSKPPSTDQKGNTGSKDLSRRGAKPGHPAHQRQLLDIDKAHRVIDCTDKHCPKCSEKNIEHHNIFSQHDVLEIEDGAVRSLIFLRQKIYCPHCRRYYLSALPNGYSNTLIGAKLHGFIASCLVNYHLSTRQLQDLIWQLWGQKLSQGAINTAKKRIHGALEIPHTAIHEEILENEEVKYIDETSWRESGKTAYVWLMTTKTLAYFNINSRRNLEARLHMLPNVVNAAVCCDGYGVYHSIKTVVQRCLCHIFRNINKFESSRDPFTRKLADDMTTCLDRVLKRHKRYRHGEYSFKAMRQYCRRYQRELEVFLEMGIYGSDTSFSRFCEGLWKDFWDWWSFLDNPSLEPTNNEAERTLRGIVILRKKIMFTQSIWGSEFVSRTASVVQTLKKRSMGVLDFLRDTMHAFWASAAFPTFS